MKRTSIKKTTKDINKKLAKVLEKISHDYIRNRDSVSYGTIAGYCFDCGEYVVGQQFQAGHWIPSSKGALTRYHPHNMHGQAGKCNCKYDQEKVKINYTFKMQDKYGYEHCMKLKAMSEKMVKANTKFYEDLIELYKEGDETKIVGYIDSIEYL